MSGGAQDRRRVAPKVAQPDHRQITGRSTVVPDWGTRDLKTGTVRAAVRQLGLNWQTFAVA